MDQFKRQKLGINNSKRGEGKGMKKLKVAGLRYMLLLPCTKRNVTDEL